jgi:hypothetical protein
MNQEQTINQKDFWKEASWCEVEEERLDPVIIALTIIWGGLVALGSTLGVLPNVEPWSLFFLGVGALVIIEFGIRWLVPSFRKDLLGTLGLAGFIFFLGGWTPLWSAVLILMGAYFVVRTVSKN